MTNAYTADLCLWAQQQAALLDAGRLEALDQANLARQMRALSEQVQDDAGRNLRVLLECAVRLAFGTPAEHRVAAKVTASRRTRLLDSLVRAPSIRPGLQANLQQTWLRASKTESDECARAGVPLPVLPIACPWTLEQLLDPATLFEAS